MTNEQSLVIFSKKPKKNLNACAGSGKTYTIEELIKANPQLKILYIVFNKAMEQEAVKRFGHLKNVVIRTGHSLAYESVGNKYRDKLSIKDYRPIDLIKEFKMPEKQENLAIAKIVLSNIDLFLKSDKKDFSEMLSPKGSLKYGNFNFDNKMIFEATNIIFNKMKDLKSNTPISHDFYLKLWSLNNPDFSKGFDMFIVDEAQDSSYPLMSVMQNQTIDSLIAGDSNQKIYAWRGAVDVLVNLPGDMFYLTNSFRVGKDIAKISSNMLKDLKRFDVPMTGLNESQKIVEKINTNNPYAVVCRTRASILDEAIIALKENKKVFFEGGVDSYKFNSFFSASAFKKHGHKGEVIDEFKSFQTWNDLEAYANLTEDIDLNSIIKIVNEYGDSLSEIVKKIKENVTTDKNIANVILTTTHKSKGAQYFNLKIANDHANNKFLKKCLTLPTSNKNFKTIEDISEEVNLNYVAYTRAYGEVQIPEDAYMYL